MSLKTQTLCPNTFMLAVTGHERSQLKVGYMSGLTLFKQQIVTFGKISCIVKLTALSIMSENFPKLWGIRGRLTDNVILYFYFAMW